MEVNVLDYMMGKIQLMEYEDKRWRLVVFLSKSLNETERNYNLIIACCKAGGKIFIWFLRRSGDHKILKR